MSDTEVLTTPVPGTPAPEAAPAPAPVAETPPAPPRREPSGPVLVPFDSALPGVTSAEIRAELARRTKRVPKLLAEHALVIQQMVAIEDALESIDEDLGETTAVPAERAPRTSSGTSLKEAVASVVQPGETVTPAEAVARVRASGYASTAANLGQMAATTLAKDERFDRIGRGQYRRTHS
jgi:hypothetical protein